MTFFTSTGLRVSRAFEVLRDFKGAYELASGETPSWDRDTFLGAIAAAFAEVQGETNEALQALWDAFDPDNAQGQALDTHAKLAGIFRQNATASSATVSLTGAGGTFIPQGRIVEDTSGLRWTTQAEVTLPGSVVVRANETGPIARNAGEINTIITPVPGWTGVTNAAPAIPGTNRQSDASLRFSRTRALQSGARTSFRGIRRDLEALAFLESVLVVHNPTSTPQTVQGIALPAHAFRAIVFPNTITPAEVTEVFETIVESSPIGIESTGSQTRLIEGYPVKFSFASPLTVNIALEVVIDTDSFSAVSVLAEVEATLERYLATLRVGDAVRKLAICREVSGVNGALAVQNVTVNSVAADLVINADQYPVPGTITATEAP